MTRGKNLNEGTYKRFAFALMGALSCGPVLAGFGGMGNVEANDAGGVSFTNLVLAIALLGIGGYLAIQYASRFDGNQGYGRIAIGILAVLVLFALFK